MTKFEIYEKVVKLSHKWNIDEIDITITGQSALVLLGIVHSADKLTFSLPVWTFDLLAKIKSNRQSDRRELRIEESVYVTLSSIRIDRVVETVYLPIPMLNKPSVRNKFKFYRPSIKELIKQYESIEDSPFSLGDEKREAILVLSKLRCLNTSNERLEEGVVIYV